MEFTCALPICVVHRRRGEPGQAVLGQVLVAYGEILLLLVRDRLVVAEISDPPGAGVFPHRVDLALEVRLSRGSAAGVVGQVDHVGPGRGPKGACTLAEDAVLGDVFRDWKSTILNSSPLLAFRMQF